MRSPARGAHGAPGKRSVVTSGADHLVLEPPCKARSIGELVAKSAADVRFRAKVCRLHARGARVLCEFLGELSAKGLLLTDIEARIERCLALVEAALDLLGLTGWILTRGALTPKQRAALDVMLKRVEARESRAT